MIFAGFIAASDFYDILVAIKSHLLTDPVRNIFYEMQNHYDIKYSVCTKTHNIIFISMTFKVKNNIIGATHGQQVSYPYFVAFISLLSNIELIKKIYLNATNGSRTTEITKGKMMFWVYY